MAAYGAGSQRDGATTAMAQPARSGDVALLIDYENLQKSLRRNFTLTTPRMSLIIQEAQERGRLVLARAYANWTSPDLSIDAENLYRQGIDLIYVPTRKNSADIRIAVDAVETCARSENLSTFVIVTGDGDLIHPLNHLRQNGRRVVVIGVDAAMSRLLSAAADEVLLYERDLDPSVGRRPAPQRLDSQQPARQVRAVAPSRAAVPQLAPVDGFPPAERGFELLQETLRRRGGGEPMVYQDLGHWLSLDHNLKPKAWYGVPFSVFMEAAEQEGSVALTTSGGNSFATLPSDSAAERDESADETGDERGDDRGEADGETAAEVRLEALRPEEQQALFATLGELERDGRYSYLTFRKILSHLVQQSVLPRLSEWQLRRLLNDLADRQPPILIRGTRKSRTPGGKPLEYPIFSLTPDDALLHVPESD
ncbi:MAG: NYN domain-containing protein [Chloroflexia bacterium]|nr:NYN domain-containing protein [Chloroflexia bacterium]